MDLDQIGMGNVQKVLKMALQGHLESSEAPEVVFWPKFKPYKGLEKEKIQMPLSLGLSGSSF
jgi:hypothetical protein